MSVIRHGEIIEVVYDAERIVVHAPACASHGRAACDCEPMVFVPTEQLRGAVNALARLFDLELVASETGENEHGQAAIREARTIVNHARGSKG